MTMPRAVNPIEQAIEETWLRLKDSLPSGHSVQFAFGYDSALSDFAARVKPALEAALAASPSSGAAVIEAPWRAIETAPKDRHILVYDEGAIAIALWVEDSGKSGWWDMCFMEPPPTHWMPLPAPPSRSGEADPPHAHTGTKD